MNYKTVLDFISDLTARYSAFLQNDILNWLSAIGIVLALYLIGSFSLTRARKLFPSSERHLPIYHRAISLALNATLKISILAVAILVASALPTIGSGTKVVIWRIVAAILIFQAARWASTLYSLFLRDQLHSDEDPSRQTAFGLLNFVGLVLLWAIAALLTLDNLGVDVTALIAGLGIGGIAVALAVQNVLGDLLGSLSIILDRPFEIGDFIVVDEISGSVERIGIKTTRIRSLSGEQIVLSNNDLLKSRIKNFKRMYERRVVNQLGVTYSTPLEKLRVIPDWIREAINSQENVRFDRAHFKAYGDSALQFEFVFFVASREFNVYMDILQRVNLHLFEKFEREGVEFAFPTRTLHLASAPKALSQPLLQISKQVSNAS